MRSPKPNDNFAYVTRRGDQPCTALLFQSESGEDLEGVLSEGTHHVLSVVGPYVSLCHNERWEGGFRPVRIWDFSTRDLRTGEQLSLHDIFEETEIHAAMMQHPRIVRALGGMTPNTLAELLYNLGGDCLDVGEPMSLTRFALHSVADGRAKVRFWAHNDRIDCWQDPTKVDLEIPVPPALLPLFETAKRRKLLPLTDLEPHSVCDESQQCATAETAP
jgi:hypothetical protein